MEQPLLMLVYTSKSESPIDQKLIDDLLTVAKEKNTRDEITGYLVARSKYFLQLLEGPEDKVRECFARIKQDIRHSNIVIQGEGYLQERIAPKWSMGVVILDDAGRSDERLVELFEAGRRGKPYADVESVKSIVNIFSRDAKIV
jgi:hypothetical protein